MTTSYTEPLMVRGRDPRRGTDPDSIRRSFINHIAFTQAKVPGFATPNDQYMALAMVVRDRLIARWIATRKAYYRHPEVKRVYYLSLEFLIGRTMGNALVNMDLYSAFFQALHEAGYELEDLREVEEDAGLGNGGLGRLAACFLDSMATLGLAGYGYGIRYDYGIFRQRVRNGYQVEEADDWLRMGNPWEIARPEHTFRIHFYGRTEHFTDEQGRYRVRWVDTQDILAMPYDTPIPGYGNHTVNTLRLFSAKSTNDFDLTYFNHGDYVRACEDKFRTENITRILYPRDDFYHGRELRLKQEYLLVSAALQDVLHRFLAQHDDWRLLPDQAAVQLNDTHPALAVPELMRLLMDEHGLEWDVAWNLTVRTLAYTNHTVMPEALERWRVALMGNLLPRHLEIIYEINQRFLDEVRSRFPGEDELVRRVSLIEEGDEKKVRMAHLAVVGSHAVNGVSALHSDILKKEVLADFHLIFPRRIRNVTNGVTPRRWLKKANPLLAMMITEAIGDRWVTDLTQLRKLEPLADDADFRARWRQTKWTNKKLFSVYWKERYGVGFNPDTMFDVQIKRLHEYKRQMLLLLYAVTLYNRIRSGTDSGLVPRTILIGGKSAPAYHQAKLCTKLTTAIGETIANDPAVAGRLTVAFVENYRISLAERLIPAADLSEQISLAGTEASGTGNMKLSLNGALTIGTLDGANVEIREEVGDDNFFLFGMTADQVRQRQSAGYQPREHYENVPELRTALDQIASNHFCPHEPGVFQLLVDRLLRDGDPFMVLADYADYAACQDRVDAAYRDQESWTRMSILNTARMGKFSSDRAIMEYAKDIWNVSPVHVELDGET